MSSCDSRRARLPTPAGHRHPSVLQPRVSHLLPPPDGDARPQQPAALKHHHVRPGGPRPHHSAPARHRHRPRMSARLTRVPPGAAPAVPAAVVLVTMLPARVLVTTLAGPVAGATAKGAALTVSRVAAATARTGPGRTLSITDTTVNHSHVPAARSLTAGPPCRPPPPPGPPPATTARPRSALAPDAGYRDCRPTGPPPGPHTSP